MRQKLDLGSVLAAVGAIALIVSLFLHWFATLSAWSSFELVDWLLAAIAVATLLGVARGGLGAPGPARWLPLAGAAAVFLVASQLIDPPPVAHDATRQIGAWLGLAAAAAIAAGGALASAAISVVVDVRGRERRVRVPAVDRREGGGSPGATSVSQPPTSATPLAAEGDPDRTQPLRPMQPPADRDPGP